MKIDWHFGVTAKDWDKVAKKENLAGFEVDLRELQV